MRHVLRDLLSGSVVSAISLAYCASFAAFIFAGPLAAGFAPGLNAILLGAGVSSVAVALGASLRRVVAGPDTPVVAVFGALALSIAAALPADAAPDAVAAAALAAIAVATALTGLLLFAIGAARIGSAFRFVPYSVIAGFLVASGCLLIAGGFRVATGARMNLMEIEPLVDAASLHAAQLAFAAGFVAAVMLIRRRLRQFYVLPLAFFCLIALAYAYLALRPAADAAGWFLDAGARSPDDVGVGLHAFGGMRLADALPYVLGRFGEIAAVAVITAMAVVLNTSGLEAVWKTNADLDRDFRVNGLANILSGALGGIAGNISLNRSLLNRECGAAGRLSGVVPGAVCFATLLFGPGVLTTIPTPALAGLLFFLGVSILVNSLSWGSLKRNWPEFLLTWLIAALILTTGYLEGLAGGLVGAALLFAYTYSRVSVVRRAFSRRDRSSAVDRAPEHARLLADEGGRIRGFDLHGYLFFATSSRLVEDLKRRFQEPTDAPIASLILDFRLVSGVDVTTAFSFAKLRNACEERGATLLLSGMQPAVAEALAASRHGVVDGRVARRFDTLDGALEWAEEDLLRSHADVAGADEGFERWLARQFGDDEIVGAVMDYLERLTFAAGDRMVEQGAPPDSVDLIAAGRVAVFLERPGAPPLRLRSMASHAVIGEMGFYRGHPRAAAVVAAAETVTLRMRRDAYDRMAREHPAAAAAFDRFIIRTLADRLTYANAEIAGHAL